jgi:hypothetical protein
MHVPELGYSVCAGSEARDRRELQSGCTSHFTADVAATLAYWGGRWASSINGAGATRRFTRASRRAAPDLRDHDPEFTAALAERHLAPDIFLWVSIDEVSAVHRAHGAEILKI